VDERTRTRMKVQISLLRSDRLGRIGFWSVT
jgi:hypothetical protein